jgi:hypothetical protein
VRSARTSRQSRDDGALQAQLLPLLRELTAGCHGSTLEQLQNAVALIQERTGAAMARWVCVFVCPCACACVRGSARRSHAHVVVNNNDDV